MAKKNNLIPKDNNIIRMPLEELMPDNYLPYAVEVAKDRALPDVRDGLKPVHRRILYGAYLLKAFPDKPYYKSARIVGDILGKFHPHGDSSVYDAMTILAQDFSTREPLIDGHGNWGSVDGDSAAAMRYTEARLSKIALTMLQDIDKDVVEMVPNYSDSEIEPKVLPARYPNLLVNGTFGIAVGLATNIPPHNLGEVIDGTLAYIDNNELTTGDLMKYIKGPDLPTGGILIGENPLKAAYETGEGKVTLRSRASIDTLENGRLGIVITEFPYRRNKAKLLQTISEMTGDKRHAKALESIADIRDESDRTGIRSVIEFKKNVDEDTAEKVLKYLFKKTDLQCNLSFNMVALADGKPETLGLKEILKHYVNHQKDVVTRRTKRELEIAEKRYHVVEGFIKAIEILDEVIATIRASKSKANARENLIEKFEFTEMQADAILELMLYRLTGLEIKVFQNEYAELAKKIKALKKILENEKELLKVIKKELIAVKEQFENPRRTEIVANEDEAKIDLEELIVVEDIMITLSKDGFIKRVPLKTYNRSNQDAESIEYREGDLLKHLIKANTRDNLLLFTDTGYMYQLKGNSIPEYKWKEKGERLDTLIRGLNLEEENIITVESVESFSEDKMLKFITSSGYIKNTSFEAFNTSYSKLLALKLKHGEKLANVVLVDKSEEPKFVEIKTEKGLTFTVKEPKTELVDRNIMGTELCFISKNDSISEISYTEEYLQEKYILAVKSNGEIKIASNKRKDSYMKVEIKCLDDILMFTNLGKVHRFKGGYFSKLQKSIDISELVDDFEKDEMIINVISIDSYTDDFVVYFITQKGLIKKTILSEFEAGGVSQIAYKLRTSADRVATVELAAKDDGEFLLVTRKGMGIKFEVQGINLMGKVASGVVAISLKEEDEVVFAQYVPNNVEDVTNKVYNEIAVSGLEKYKLVILSKNNERAEIAINEVRVQNRAGRGNNMISLAFDDYVKEVLIKEVL
ncbi:DNA topoisomerase IV subunit A [Inconstantimicrobium mannanitabidum]|uniref:DNA topoisomerase (ATP-hydrolyzing) n=1 Tax=Inconstantimicrobium mannanitabidum TaxID=1604901 RepID=A0ACB5R8D4_9CLOT|nr:DNA topoisomerase IV subunit A [Clostridium sp. TW13]GKX65437.1 DNA topoisomerase (ATP-hydrolyzing) [Clostridium sp. TW13]